MHALTRKSLADVTRRKGRTLLMILGILIGVLGITAVTQASDQLGGAFFYSTDPQAVPNIDIEVNALPASVASTIQHIPDVEQFQVRTVYTTPWRFAGQAENYTLQIFAYADMQHIQLWPFQITSGRLPGRGEIVLDTRNLQEGYPATLGGTVSVTAPDGHQVSLRVVGLSRTRGIAVKGLFANPIGYMSPAGLDQIASTASSTGRSGSSTEILVKTPDVHVASTYTAITRLLENAHLRIDEKTSNWRYSSGNADLQLSVAGPLIVIQLLTGLSLLLVCVMIFNAVSTLLTEQVKIVGTMKAVGGTRLPIVGSYLLTVGIYSLVGTVLGLALGLLAGYQLASRMAETVQVDVGPGVLLDAGPFHVSPWVPITSIAVGLLIPQLSALWPLWTGTRITVREAMSAYGVQAGSGMRKYAWGYRLRWVPQTSQLGVRGLFRKPARATLTLLALTISCAVFLAVQITNTSLGTVLAQELSPIENPDLRIDLGDAGNTVHSQPVDSTIQSLPNVKSVVPVAFGDATIAQRHLFLTGVPADRYQPLLVAGRWLRPHEQGTIVINDTAAQQLGLQVGEHLSMQVDIQAPQAETRQVSWTVVGVVHDVDYLSGSNDPTGPLGEAFTTPETLNRVLHKPADYADRVLIHTYDHSAQALQQLQAQIRAILVRDGLGNAGVRTYQDLFQGVVDPLPTIYSLFYAVAILLALIGLVSLALTIAASVLERRLEIGILRSLGASGWHVGFVFCIEGLALATLAWGLGVILGLPGGIAIMRLLSMFLGPHDVSIDPMFLLTTLLFTIGIASISSCGPALSASQVRIRETLLYE